MSSTLMWKPSTKEGEPLPYELKKVLSKRLWGEKDGKTKTVTYGDIGYLEGLRDAEIDGAQQLIDLINRYDCLELWLQS